MYPEVSLLGPEGKKLLSFKQDSMDSMNEGFVELWLIMSNTSRQFIFRKRLTSSKAMKQWNYLANHGWTVVEEQELAA